MSRKHIISFLHINYVAYICNMYIYTYLWVGPGHVTRLRLRKGNLEQLLALPPGQAWGLLTGNFL